MSLSAVLVVLTMLLTVPLPQSGALGDLAWLEGEWLRATRGGEAIERWKRNGDGWSGEGLTVRDGETTLRESLMLVEMAGDVYYIAKPTENPYPVAFRLVSRDGGAFVFENTAHDFPQRISYRRTGDDTMTATIEGPGQGGGETQRIEFAFARR